MMTNSYCPICGTNSWRYLKNAPERDYEYHIDYKFKLIQCTGCGLIKHENAVTYDTLKTFYPDDYFTYSEDWARNSSSVFARMKQWLYNSRARRVSWYVPCGKILDVGCGNGSFFKSLSQYGCYDKYGCDIKNKHHDNIIFSHGCLENIHYEDNYFDAIVIDNLLEHVPDVKVFLNKVYGILKPGGYVFGTTPNHNSIDRRLFGKYWGGYHAPRHLYLFNKMNLTRLFMVHRFNKVWFPMTANSGDYGVSIQNWLRRNKPRTRYTRGWYFPIVCAITAPVAWVSSLFGLNGAMDFVAQKKG